MLIISICIHILGGGKKELAFAMKLPFASTIIGRLIDDITSHKLVANAWKDINEEFLRPTIVPMPLLTCALYLSRVIDVVYKGQDGYIHVGKTTKDNVASLLIDLVNLFYGHSISGLNGLIMKLL